MQNWRRWRNADHPSHSQTGRRLAPRPVSQDREPALYGVGDRGDRRVRPMRSALNLCLSLRRTERRPHARPGDVFRAWIQRRATPERFLLPERLCRRGAVEPHHRPRQLRLPRQLAPAARAIRQGVGQQPAIAGLRRSLRAADSRPHAPKPFPAPERMGKRVRSTTSVQCNRSRRAAMQDSSAHSNF